MVGIIANGTYEVKFDDGHSDHLSFEQTYALTTDHEYSDDDKDSDSESSEDDDEAEKKNGRRGG